MKFNCQNNIFIIANNILIVANNNNDFTSQTFNAMQILHYYLFKLLSS